MAENNISRNNERVPTFVSNFIRYLAIPNCPHCGESIDPGDKANSDEDHILARKWGGDNRVTNLDVTCPHCNRSLGSNFDNHKLMILNAQKEAKIHSQTIFKYPINNLEEIKLRVPQKEGYEAILDYFNSGGAHAALLEIPTAVGKTLLIAMAPYGVAEGPVLVVAPNVKIRSQITSRLGGTESNPSLL